MRLRLEVSVVVVVLAGLACSKPAGGGASAGAPGTTRLGLQQAAPRVPSLGVKRVEGSASELRVSPSGTSAVTLIDAETPPITGVPPNFKQGALWLVPLTGETTAVKVASGVSNLPGGLMYSPDGKYLLTLGSFDPQQQHGDLLIADVDLPNEERAPVARRVTYVLASPDSASVAYVSDGVLHLGALPKGPFRQLAGEVATAEFAPDAKHIYFRRKVNAGGGLYQVDVRAEKAPPKRLFDSVGEFAVSDDSRTVVAMARTNPAQFGFELHVADAASLKSRKVSDDVMRFALSRDAKWLAFMRITATLSKAKGGGMNPQDLQMGELVLAPLAGGEGRVVGSRVREFEFTQDSTRLMFRDRYQELALIADGKVEKVGDLTAVALPDGAPVVWQTRCPNYAVAPGGKAVAYTVRIERPEYSRHLYLRREGAEPVKVAEWLYEYAFSPDGARLYFRTNCTRSGRSCDVRSVAVANPTEKPKVEAEATFNFKLSDDGSRLLYTYPHTTDELFDVSVVNLATNARATLDQYVKLPVLFAGADGKRVVYAVNEKKRSGVYVADAVP